MIYSVPSALKCHQLTGTLISRFKSDNPSLIGSDTFAQRMYLSIYKLWEASGEAEAKRYVREARLM